VCSTVPDETGIEKEMQTRGGEKKEKKKKPRKLPSEVKGKRNPKGK
jgi:hypothetical protein